MLKVYNYTTTSLQLLQGCLVLLSKIETLAQSQVPGLAVVIVGTRKDSQSYVSMKRKACAEVGIKSFDIDLPEQVPEAELIATVHELNAHPDVHGWFVFYLRSDEKLFLVSFTPLSLDPFVKYSA